LGWLKLAQLPESFIVAYYWLRYIYCLTFICGNVTIINTLREEQSNEHENRSRWLQIEQQKNGWFCGVYQRGNTKRLV
jgi:hypothetical protein